MIAFTRKYSHHIIVALLGIIMVLLIILLTDMHVARINQQMQQMIHSSV